MFPDKGMTSNPRNIQSTVLNLYPTGPRWMPRLSPWLLLMIQPFHLPRHLHRWVRTSVTASSNDVTTHRQNARRNVDFGARPQIALGTMTHGKIGHEALHSIILHGHKASGMRARWSPYFPPLAAISLASLSCFLRSFMTPSFCSHSSTMALLSPYIASIAAQFPASTLFLPSPWPSNFFS